MAAFKFTYFLIKEKYFVKNNLWTALTGYIFNSYDR